MWMAAMDPTVQKQFKKLFRAGVYVVGATIVVVGTVFVIKYFLKPRQLTLQEALTSPENLVNNPKIAPSAEAVKSIASELITERSGNIADIQSSINQKAKDAEAKRAEIIKLQELLAKAITKRAGVEGKRVELETNIGNKSADVQLKRGLETQARNRLSVEDNALNKCLGDIARIQKEKDDLYQKHLNATKSFLDKDGNHTLVKMNPSWAVKDQEIGMRLNQANQVKTSQERATANARAASLTATNNLNNAVASQREAEASYNLYLAQIITPIDNEIIATKNEIQTLANIYATLTNEKLI